MNKLQLVLSLLPLAAVAIGILTYVIALRADLTGAISDVQALKAAQGEQIVVAERLAGLEASLLAIPDAGMWQDDIGQRVVALESTQVEGYDDAELGAQLQDLALQNADAATRLDYVISEYGPAIETLREGTGLSERLADLSREVSSNATQLDGLDLSGYGDIAGRLAAMEIIVSTISSDGEVDLSPLVARLAELEGRVEGVSDVSSQVRRLQTDVATLKGRPTGGSSYDDASIRRSISSIQSDVSSLESSVRTLRSSSGGAAYDDSSIRRSLSSIQSTVSSLESSVRTLRSSSGGAAYDDSSLQSQISTLSSSISTLQSTVTSLQGQVGTQPTVVDYSGDIDMLLDKINALDSWLEGLDNTVGGMSTGGGDYSYQIEALENWMIDLENTLYEVTATSGSGGTDYSNDIADLQYELEIMNDNLGQAFDYIFDELQRLESDFLASSTSSGSSSGSTNTAGVPEKLYVDHSTNSNQYNGTYVRAGDYNGFPMWECHGCNGTSGQFSVSYLFRYPVGFTASGWVWVVQPIPPTTEWMANSYLDAEWPWESTNWSGNVQSVTIAS